MSTRIHDAGLKSYQACTHLFYLHVQANPMLQEVPLFAILRSSGKHDKHTCGAAMQTTAPIRDQPTCWAGGLLANCPMSTSLGIK
jgi:hypothetical protein